MSEITESLPQLDDAEKKRRSLILSGNEWKVIFMIALPLVVYDSLSQVFQLIDTLIAANMSAGVVSTVSFIAQIESMLTAIGSGLALGGSIIISRSYGAGNMAEVRRQISTLFFLCLGIGFLVLIIIIPGAYPFLKLLRMPEDLIEQGTIYFMLDVTSIIFLFINTIYLSIEKSRGNTKVIMLYNCFVIVIKTTLNFLIIHFMKRGLFDISVAMLLLPAATLIAQGVLTGIALKNLTSRKNPFRVSLTCCDFKKRFLSPLMNLSIPVFLEKFIFSFGKVIVNSMCASLGSTVVGALGVSNRIGGLSTNPLSGFQEAESALISQNIGNKNFNRALGIFYRTLIINLSFALIFFVLTGIFKDTIINLFAKGNASFAAEIDKIYTYERLDTILISINTSVMGLLYGFGKTRVSMILNLMRLFCYRIPPLYLLMTLTHIGTPAAGMAMLISNGLTGITAGIVAYFFIKKVRREMMQSPTESCQVNR
jgi:putative MATE family efflux protein